MAKEKYKAGQYYEGLGKYYGNGTWGATFEDMAFANGEDPVKARERENKAKLESELKAIIADAVRGFLADVESLNEKEREQSFEGTDKEAEECIAQQVARDAKDDSMHPVHRNRNGMQFRNLQKFADTSIKPSIGSARPRNYHNNKHYQGK